MGPHISIKGEHVFNILGFPVTNSILTTALVLLVFFFIAQYYLAESRKKKDKGLGYYAINGALNGLYGLFHSVLHAKTFVFYPLLGAFFFFILLNNWSGLMPGVGSVLIQEPVKQEVVADASYAEQEEHVDDQALAVAESPEDTEVAHESFIPLFRGGTADLNTTVALALISVFITQVFGFKYLGAKLHLGKYFNFSSPVMLFVGLLELVLEFARILSFAFRLFGNVFAGEVLLTVVPFLLPVFFSFVSAPMFFMEVFVGAVQALVFTMLSAVFMSMAIASHDH